MTQIERRAILGCILINGSQEAGIVIQGSRREPMDGALRSDRLRVAGDPAVVAEQAARRSPGRRPAGAERDILGAEIGSALGGPAGALWSADDDLQSVQPLAQSRRLGSADGRGDRRP